MKYLAQTISDHIMKTADGKDTARFVLPSYPARVLLQVGADLEERLARVTVHRVAFVYGIARRLVDQWGASGSTTDQAAAGQARQKGWYNADDNLTALRNRQRDPESADTLVTLIAGYGHIDDQASLRDFYHVDQTQVWDLCLHGSFKPWVEANLADADLEADGPAVEAIADVLDALYAHGLADLPTVSAYLESLDLTGASGPSDVYRTVLGHLDRFNLPSMAGLAGTGRRRSLANYLTPAQEFLNYSRFLDDTARKSAIRSIDRYEKAEKRREPREEDLGEYGSLAELLTSLRRYVEAGSDEDRRRLKTADFPFILDAILGYRPPRKANDDQDPAPPKVRKLAGLAPEVFLRALWLTLADYVKDAGDRDTTPQEDLRGISLQSHLFRHDLETDDEDSVGSAGVDDRAQAFLGRALGGLDRLLEEQIDLSRVRDGEAVTIDSRLCPRAGNDIHYARTATSEPHLAFRVVISHGSGSLEREYLWRLPQNHQTYLLDNLFNWAHEWFVTGSNGLPAYATPYIPELFLAQDEEDVNRLTGMALRSQGRRIVDLLAAPGISDSDTDDPVMPSLRSLSVAYQVFLGKVRQDGFFAALADSFDVLRQAYETACEAYLHHAARTTLGGLLFKAFSLFDAHNTEDEQWAWHDYADAFIATPLHPAVLDMLRNQQSFLCEGFSAYATDALVKVDLRSRPFAERKWNALVDLARMERPLFGTLRNRTHVMDSSVRGYDYLHLVGNCRAPLTATWRLLLEYDPTEDGDDVEDEDLFRETRASQLVRTVLLDYRAMHPHAEDGLTIGAYCGGEIQPLIAGIDRYLERALAEHGDAPYGIRLVLFSGARDDTSVTRWLDAWRDRWQAVELPTGKKYYDRCKISIAFRVVPAEKSEEQLAALLRRTPLDVLFFSDFIAADESHFDQIQAEWLPDDYRKFPVLEKACCAVTGGAKSFRRDRILSNRRFELASLHSEVMARLVRGAVDPKDRHVVVSSSDFSPWRAPVDAGHEASAWVVCIDPTADERLLRIAKEKGSRRREIIGFGTGVGAHGEANFTVSTEQFLMVDVKKKISSQLALRFGSWNAAVRDGIADSLVREASGMAGLSVVRATGPSEYVRDYISYATVRKLLPKDTQAFCDEMVSLDAFRHWFDDGEDQVRPDLLRLRARIVDGLFQVEAQVIECKLAQESEGYLSEARAQVEAGLKRLSSSMRPRESSKPVGLEDRPDQRYWWLQLHRLIASRGSTSMPHYGATLTALERLSEGYFDISWQGAVVAFWSDVPGGDVRREAEWPVSLDEQTAIVPAWGTAADFVRKACLEGTVLDLFAGASAVWRRCCREDKKEGLDTGGEAAKTEKRGAAESKQIPSLPEDDKRVDKDGLIPPSKKTSQAEASGDREPASPASRVPDRILLGTSTTGGNKVYWEFGHRDLPNRHILVFGASGTGKTYTIQALLCELGRAGQNALIVDYTNGFTTGQLEEVLRERLKPRQHIVRREPLPVNPFRRQCDIIEGEAIDEDPTITAQRVRGVFAEVYLLGDQQKSAIYTAIRDGISHEGASFGLTSLMTRLEDLRAAGGPVGSAAGSVASKIQPFVDMNPFGQEDPESWEKPFNDQESRCHVIQLAGFARDTARLITEFSLIDLYRYYRASGSKDQPRVIVLDEVQNLDHSLDSPLGQLLTEGRKFGISLILATQTMSNLDKDQRDRLFQASHKLFFRPADTELRSFAQLLESATGERSEDWERRLSSLGKGECYSLGPAVNESSQTLDTKKYFRIRITSLRERF